MSWRYPILIHSAFYRILRESPPVFRSRVQKALMRLRDGNWSGGTQVKRLAGVGHAVFEARLDAGNRLLFTAVRAADRDDPARLSTHLQIWDVVHHDSVTRRARRNLVPEAEFLDFKTLEAFDLAEPPPHPAAAFDEIASRSDEPLLNFLIPDEGFEPRAAEGIYGGVRWFLAPEFMLADEAEFQRMIDRAEGELELKLMRDQYEILRAPGPLLLAGGAGSGKTTIAIHRLVEARLQLESGRLLYLSYSPWLVDYAKRLYRDVIVARGGDPDVRQPSFFTFSDLYLRLVPQMAADRPLVTGDAFASWLRPSAPNIDAALVWEEVRSILKGACLNLGRAMLDEREYFELGRKRAPLFVNDRPEIFAIAGRYREWLTGAGRMDQIDLCRAAFLASRQARGSKYDVIVCDEAQDLTELETAFVLSLSASASLTGVMLTGDTQQIVNPTGFRWAEARQAIMKASGASMAPRAARLRRNCRSARPLVDLANAVLGLKQEIFGRYEDDGPEDAVVEGPAPIHVVAEEKQVLEAIRGFGPRCAILVLDEAEGRRLGAALETTRIFHVRDSKGLEFDTVVLWKLFAAANGVVARFLRGASGADRDARLKQFLQLLYVAVTRARRHLAVFDGVEAHPFWTAHRFHGRLESEGVETLGRLFRDSASAAEWAREGRHYFERLRYRQAAECYRRAGMAEKETTALAMHAETLERWQDALGYWQSIGVEGRQAELLEKLGRFQEARDVHARLGREKEAARLDLILLEKAGRWAEAAERWEKAGSPADAVRCYQRAGNHARALKLDATAAEKHKDWKRAADYWSSLKSYEAAARCYREAGDKKSAALAMAHQYEGAKDWNKAAAAYQRAGDRAKARELMALALESAGETAMAASIYERLGQHDRAFQLYRKAGDQSALDRFAVERADLRQPQLQAVEKLFERANYSLAIKLIEKRQAVIRMRLDRTDWYVSDSADRQLMKERDALAKLQIECRAYLAEHAKSWSKAAALWRRLRQFERADLAQEKHIEAIADPVERGVAWLQAGALERATNLFQSAGAADWLIRARAVGCQREKQWEQAAELWQSVGDTINHAAAMARVAYEKQDWPSAARWHQLAGQKNLAAEAARRARMEHAESDRKRRTETPLF